LRVDVGLQNEGRRFGTRRLGNLTDWRTGASCVADAMRTVEAAVAVGVAPFFAKTSPKAASPTIINAATIMTATRMWLL
jgi:hypothetical protein